MGSVVVGLGKTGAACLRYFARHGIPASATDSRRSPPGLAELGKLSRQFDLRLGGFDAALLEGATQLVLSPGVSPDEPIVRAARARGIEIVGDVELFARAVQGPVIGITGTNGKSTVTSLLAAMGAAAGRRVAAGGNLGVPALDLLAVPAPELYVLELSSFQLETTRSLELRGAAVLNITADHMDRYASMEDYARAKSRILARAATVVLNADDPRVAAMRGAAPAGAVVRTFSTERSDADYGLQSFAGSLSLVRFGEAVLDIRRLKIAGVHNAANALAALALGDAAGFPLAAMQAALEEFPGLPHRSQWVGDLSGVRYVNDSKGTNVGATLAAVQGHPGPLVVIAGGDGKGQDFTPLAAAFRGKVRHVVLIGKDAGALAQALEGIASIERSVTLEQAVIAAARAALPGDTVLLSPACASLDMFRDYGHRGEVFSASVHALTERAS